MYTSFVELNKGRDWRYTITSMGIEDLSIINRLVVPVSIIDIRKKKSEPYYRPCKMKVEYRAVEMFPYHCSLFDNKLALRSELFGKLAFKCFSAKPRVAIVFSGYVYYPIAM